MTILMEDNKSLSAELQSSLILLESTQRFATCQKQEIECLESYSAQTDAKLITLQSVISRKFESVSGQILSLSSENWKLKNQVSYMNTLFFLSKKTHLWCIG